jgi:hypothetical protein
VAAWQLVTIEPLATKDYGGKAKKALNNDKTCIIIKSESTRSLFVGGIDFIYQKSLHDERTLALASAEDLEKFLGPSQLPLRSQASSGLRAACLGLNDPFFSI